MQLKINGELKDVKVEAEMPLLWLLRDELHMTGTKFGCGIAQCGACTVIVDGELMRSCTTPVGALEGLEIETIESKSNFIKAQLQNAWIEAQVPQCGYCQSGMIMAATQLLKSNPQPNDDEIDEAITNICRCGTYNRIRKAIHLAADQISNQDLTANKIKL